MNRIKLSHRAAITLTGLAGVMMLGAALPQAASAEPAPASAASSAAVYDQGSGQLVGRRAHETVKIVREVDKATPMTAASTPSPTPPDGPVGAAKVKSHSNTNNN